MARITLAISCPSGRWDRGPYTARTSAPRATVHEITMVEAERSPGALRAEPDPGNGRLFRPIDPLWWLTIAGTAEIEVDGELINA